MSTSVSYKSTLPLKAGVSSVHETESPKRNLRMFHAESAASGIEDAAISYQSASMIAVGSDAQSVSILALMVNLLLSITCLKAPAFIERIGLTKKGSVILALLNGFVWLPLILAFLLFKDALAPIWFVLLWLFNLVPAILLSTQRDNWLSSMIPTDRMGRYLGQRMAIKSTFYLGAFFLLGILLDYYTGNAPSGFCLVFIIAFLAASANFGIFSLMKDTKTNSVIIKKEETQERFNIIDFFRELKERKLTKFILFTSLFSVTVSLCGPLYAVYMLSDLNFSYITFTFIIAAEYLARIVSMPFWGHIADKSGNIKVLNMVSLVIPFIPICWLFSPNPGFLVFMQVISGVCWGAYDLCTQNYLFKMAPPKTKLRYIIYNKSLTLFCMAIGGLLSVFLLKEIFPISGSKIFSIFLISGIFRGVVVLYLVPKLVDFGVSFKSGKRQTVIDENILNAASLKKSGLYYQPSLWERYSGIDLQQQNQALSKETGTAASTAGLYYQSDKWEIFNHKEKQPSTINVLTGIKDAISTAGLYYHPDKWMKQFSASVMMPATVLQEAGSPAAAQGLYYNQAAWDKYIKSTAHKKPAEIKTHAVSHQQPAELKAHAVSRQQPAELKTRAVSSRKPAVKKTRAARPEDRRYNGTLKPYQMQLAGI